MRLKRFVGFLGFIVFFLSGCFSHSSHQENHQQKPVLSNKLMKNDKAPPGPPPTRFEKVKPVNEPLSRYGNRDTYTVLGHKYNVLRTAQGYKAKGIASWYGSKFHSQRTSGGHEYDMYSMTAAHRTLPIPSYVKVKNLSNGREAVVKINDRGPFYKNREIDLSYAAAAKLGFLAKGTARVEIEAINTHPQNVIAHYYVQVAAHTGNRTAQALQQKLKKIEPRIATRIEHYKQYYILKAGPFSVKREAEELKARLAKQGIKHTFTVLQ